MKTSIKLTLVILMIPICYAFTNGTNEGLNVIYGVSENDPSHIELKLNKDYTFTYQDLSTSSQKIQVQGTYQIEGKKIQLISKDGQTGFHDKWKISKDNKTAKSRNGLTFYTLQREK